MVPPRGPRPSAGPCRPARPGCAAPPWARRSTPTCAARRRGRQPRPDIARPPCDCARSGWARFRSRRSPRVAADAPARPPRPWWRGGGSGRRPAPARQQARYSRTASQQFGRLPGHGLAPLDPAVGQDARRPAGRAVFQLVGPEDLRPVDHRRRWPPGTSPSVNPCRRLGPHGPSSGTAAWVTPTRPPPPTPAELVALAARSASICDRFVTATSSGWFRLGLVTGVG